MRLNKNRLHSYFGKNLNLTWTTHGCKCETFFLYISNILGLLVLIMTIQFSAQLQNLFWCMNCLGSIKYTPIIVNNIHIYLYLHILVTLKLSKYVLILFSHHNRSWKLNMNQITCWKCWCWWTDTPDTMIHLPLSQGRFT